MNDEIDDLPQDLQDALVVLCRYADRAPTASMALKEAVRTAHKYLPRPFAAEDYPGLVTAIDTIGAIAAGRYKTVSNKINGWPDACTTSTAEYVHSVLMDNTALPLVHTHAPMLAEVTQCPELRASAFELSQRLLRLGQVPMLSPNALPAWARSVHEQVVQLHGYLLGVPRRNRRRTK